MVSQMDWTTIVTVLGAITGGAGLLFYKERKKGEQLKNESSAAEEWRKLFEQRDKDCRDLDTKVDALYGELSRFRDENNLLTTENAVLKMQKCEINGCDKRKPPRPY